MGASRSRTKRSTGGKARSAAKARRDRVKLEDDRLREMLSFLKLGRYFDERMENLYRQGRLPGAIYSGRGQEGTHVGVASALGPEDSLFPTHRDLTAQLVKGVRLDRVMANFWGRIDGYTRGRDGNSHMGDWFGARTFTVLSNLPDGYPAACGAALAYRRRGEDRVAMAICGEGATSNGRWHESLNVSAIHGLPVVWVVNNNGWAYSTPERQEMPVATVAERAAAYGMPGIRVDGADVLEVYEAASEAVQRARAGQGPSLIESVSLRWKGHAGHDPARYVPRETLDEHMESRDPVRRFEELLRSWSVVDDDAVGAIDERIKRWFDEGYEFAQRSPLPEAAEVTRGVFSDDGFWSRDPVADGASRT